jgi:O-antigen ligase
MTGRARLERTLDAATPVVVAAAILTAGAAFATVNGIRDFGTPARWALLVVLFFFGAFRAAVHGRAWRFPRGTTFLLVAFCGLSLVSVAWSVNRHGTLQRAVAQPVAVAGLALLAGCAASRPAAGRRLLDGVLLGGVAVALAGFLLWLVDHSAATIPADPLYASRYKGIELSPNTAPLLLAIAAPIALWRAIEADRRGARAAYLAVLAGFAASISASGSRGALAAAFLACLLVAGLAPLPRRSRAGVAAALVVALAVAAWAPTTAKPVRGGLKPKPAFARNAELALPLDQEIGNPWWTHRNGGATRTLFNTSVRLRALKGTVGEVADRPLLGYGFGAEQWAFIDRYYQFGSGNPENGYAGILLQLGVVGLALWLVVLAVCVVPGLRGGVARIRRHPFALGAVGAAVGALLMGMSESYFHGVGGIGYVALWTALLATAVSAEVSA